MDAKDIELRVRARYEGKKTLTELTGQIEKLEAAQAAQLKAADKGTADVKELDAAYQKLERSLKAVAGLYGDVERFKTQEAALAKVGQRLDEARRKQEAFDASLTKGAALTAKQEREQLRLANAIDRAGASFAKAQARVDATGARLKQYGLNTADLATEQTRMASTIVNGNAALAKQEAAIDRATAAQKRMTGGDTAAALGRIKAQVIGLASAYVGLHQSVSLAGDSIRAFSDREGIKNQLALSVGNDKAAIDAEYAYVKGQADRIGIEFDRAAQGYAKFSAAARLAGRDQKEVRYIWETFAEVGRVANLSAEDLDGVFKALEQITSKGKIQAEELRGQLGDRLFGAFAVAAEALKDQFPDLDKALQGGLVTSEQLVLIAEQYRKTVADQLPAAVSSLAAEQARMTNGVLEFKQAIADAGFADAFRAALAEITGALKSEDGKRFAEGIAAGFSAVADAAVWLIKNLDSVLIVTKALAGLWALNMAAKATAGVIDYGKALKTLSTDIGTTIKGLGLLRGTFAVLQSALVGWSIGSYLSEEFAIVRKAGVYMATGLEEAWQRISYGAQLMFEELPRFAKNAFAEVINAATWGIRKTLEAMQKGFRALGREDLAGNIGQVIGNLTAGYTQQSGRAAEIRKNLERELAQIRRLRADMLADADRVPTAAAVTATEPTARPAGTPGKGGSTGTSEKELGARQRLVDEITRALESLDAKIDRAQTDTLSNQLDAIDSTYAALSRKIAKVGGDTGAALMSQLEVSLNQLRAQTVAKFNDGIAQEHAALLSKLEALDAAAGRKSKTDLDARLTAIRTQYESVYRELDEFRVKMEANGRGTAETDAARARLDAGVAELQQLETQKFYKDELKRLEGELNDVLATRSDRLKTIADQEAASLITSAEARQQTEDTVTTLQPKIQTLVDTARAFAVSLRGAFDPVALDAFIAKLDLVAASGAGLNQTFQITGRQIEEMIATRSVQAFDSMAEAIGGAVVGTQSWGDALRATGLAFLRFAADFLREIVMMIAKQQILKALQSTGWGGAVAGAVGAAVKHSGGVVGETSNRNRNVSPFVFMGAPRYHAGGVAGLAPDEYATILQKNEEVLSAGDPRNILNGGGQSGGDQSTPRNMRFIFVDDSRDVANWMRSAEGDDVFVEKLQRNAAVIRAMGGR